MGRLAACGAGGSCKPDPRRFRGTRWTLVDFVPYPVRNVKQNQYIVFIREMYDSYRETAGQVHQSPPSPPSLPLGEGWAVGDAGKAVLSGVGRIDRE